MRRRWTAVDRRPMRLSRPAAAPMVTVEVGRRSKAWVVRGRPQGTVLMPQTQSFAVYIDIDIILQWINLLRSRQHSWVHL